MSSKRATHVRDFDDENTSTSDDDGDGGVGADPKPYNSNNDMIGSETYFGFFFF